MNYHIIRKRTIKSRENNNNRYLESKLSEISNRFNNKRQSRQHKIKLSVNWNYEYQLIRNAPLLPELNTSNLFKHNIRGNRNENQEKKKNLHKTRVISSIDPVKDYTQKNINITKEFSNTPVSNAYEKNTIYLDRYSHV